MAMGGKGSGTEWIVAFIVILIILSVLLIVR